MILWEIEPNHVLNSYKLCPYHSIKCGVILYGKEAYVFTPISNNDVKSFLKILFRQKELPNNQTSSTITKQLTDYIRQQSAQVIIPCIRTIQNFLSTMFGVTENTFINDEYSYLLLLKRIYILIFMMRYKMPIQRKILREIEMLLLLLIVQLERDGIPI